jgi:hypothetical protein
LYYKLTHIEMNTFYFFQSRSAWQNGMSSCIRMI